MFKFRCIPDSSNKQQSKLLSQSIAFPGVPERAIEKSEFRSSRLRLSHCCWREKESCLGSRAFCLNKWEGWDGATHPSTATASPVLTLLSRNQSVIPAHRKNQSLRQGCFTATEPKQASASCVLTAQI